MEVIEFISSMADATGNKIDSVQAGLPPGFPEEVRTVVTFRGLLEGVTELNITKHDWSVGQMAIFSLIGWHQSMDKLAESLK